MRLDIFLKLSRLVSRRSLAQEFCDAGLVLVNDSASKSSKEIKVGDKIEIKRRNRITTIRVESVPAKKQVSKEQAGSLFRIEAETSISDL